jgi:CHAT domain-containing protein
LGDRAVLSYVLGERASYAFLATGDGLESARLPGGREIGTAVERYLRFLQITDGGGFRGWQAGRALFDILVGPFAKKLGASGQRIIVVPDGLLHHLPFEALVRGDGEGDLDGRGKGEFWGQTVEIGYAASATQALAGAAPDGAGIRSAKVLAVGSPDGIACDNRSRREKRFFYPLRHVEEEIGRLRRSFPEGNVTAVLGEAASEAWFKTAELGRYGVIHLAAHGVIDDENWWRSALLMTPAPRDGEDGFLTTLEIAELDLAARLVVLSGCGTGAGRLFGGAGIKGLSGAFLRAGAELVLVSLWSVDDRATAVFMGEFYRRLSEGDPPVRALARAKTWMMGAGYRDPVYWAPFVLIGKAAG